MGISSALYSGVSGLNTNSQAMSVIGNNLANTNTLGFKGSRTIFSDLLSNTINGSGGSSQVGRGVGISVVDSIFSQGTFESTESPLDLAIEGEGFFMLKEPDNDQMFYSRAGAFRFNKEGVLVNPEGYEVQGYQYNPDGTLSTGEPTSVTIPNTGLIAGTPTTDITFNTNLNSNEGVLPSPVNITDPNTYNYSSSSQIYDSLGNPHLVTIYFNKESNNTWSWSWSATLDDGTVLSDTGVDTFTFTPDGVLEDPANPGSPASAPFSTTIPAANLDWANGTTPQDITINFNTTQFNSTSTVISQDQNGTAAGELVNVTVDGEGAVVTSYSNGISEKIAHLALSKFTNPAGLSLVGNNMFAETTGSGTPRVGIPGPELGKIFTNSLEQSNVDISAEFVRMITTQRGFQANSKIITTVDELLNELINLKR